MSASQLREGFKLPELAHLPTAYLLDAGFTLSELKAAGHNVQLSAPGITAAALREAKFSVKDLSDRPLEALINVGFSVREILDNTRYDIWQVVKLVPL